MVEAITSAEQLRSVVQRLREAAGTKTVDPIATLEVFERWSTALDSAAVREIPGVPFLRLWLRSGTLKPMLGREIGAGALDGSWWRHGRALLRAFPIGLVGHWPAGNIEIQPVLSLTCGLLGGNTCFVRVPTRLVESTRSIARLLQEVDCDRLLIDRIFLATFDHSRADLQEEMARSVDGAMIWGGDETVSSVRALPFPNWARLAIFGPRLSVAAMDSAAWSDLSERAAMCRRIARDVWQFDQQACSSPQTLFLEKNDGSDPTGFVNDLAGAFEEENRTHPRTEIDPAATSAICQARASWLLANVENRAIFPRTPDWTILIGCATDIPKPTQSRTLTVLMAQDLQDVIGRFDGSVQTLGLAVKDPRKELGLCQLAGLRGVDRIVKLGQMHVFGSPWDGMDLIRPMVRLVSRPDSLN